MDPINLFTVLSVIIAIYALFPTERRLDILLRLGKFDWFLIILTLLWVHFLTFYPIFEGLGIIPSMSILLWGFNMGLASYLMILCSSLIIFIRSTHAVVNRSNIGKFQELTERLLMEKKYSDLLFLLEHHYLGLIKTYHSDYYLPRLRERLLIPINTIYIESNGKIITRRILQITNLIKEKFAYLLPNSKKEAKKAQDILSRVLLSRDFISYLSKARPYFALDLYRTSFGESTEFISLYINSLLEDTKSIFYFEIKRNQIGLSRHRYVIDERNKFIAYFLKDTKIAYKTSIYKPLGDFVLEMLDNLSKNPNIDLYNQSLGSFSEEGCWDSPIYCVIRFFDLMVTEALFQNIQWHMWLFYLPMIANKIVNNLNHSLLLGSSVEFPTPYHYLLFDIVETLKNWIELVTEIPTSQSNIVLNNELAEHENDNIPKSAILALSSVIFIIITNESLSMRFKKEIVEMVLRLWHELNSRESTQPFARVLQSSIIEGGIGNRDNPYYLSRLSQVVSHIDPLLMIENKVFVDLINKAIL